MNGTWREEPAKVIVRIRHKACGKVFAVVDENGRQREVTAAVPDGQGCACTPPATMPSAEQIGPMVVQAVKTNRTLDLLVE